MSLKKAFKASDKFKHECMGCSGSFGRSGCYGSIGSGEVGQVPRIFSSVVGRRLRGIFDDDDNIDDNGDGDGDGDDDNDDSGFFTVSYRHSKSFRKVSVLKSGNLRSVAPNDIGCSHCFIFCIRTWIELFRSHWSD